MRNVLIVTAVMAILALKAKTVSADVYTWTLDSARSYSRLNFADQTQDINTTLGTTAATAKARSMVATGTTGSGVSNAWNDTNGRKASLSGTFQADYVNHSSVTLLAGTTDISAVPALNIGPNPADWDPSTQKYLIYSKAPADFASKIFVSAFSNLVNANMPLAIRDFKLSLSSSQILLGSGTTIAAGSTSIGLPSASVQMMGTSVGGIFDIPDQNTPISNAPVSNISGGEIVDLGGGLRQLNLNYVMPLQIDLGNSFILTGTVSGVIVANTNITVPEVSPITLVALGLAGIAFPLTIRRRRLRHR